MDWLPPVSLVNVDDRPRLMPREGLGVLLRVRASVGIKAMQLDRCTVSTPAGWVHGELDPLAPCGLQMRAWAITSRLGAVLCRVVAWRLRFRAMDSVVPSRRHGEVEEARVGCMVSCVRAQLGHSYFRVLTSGHESRSMLTSAGVIRPSGPSSPK
jgi:hypothetical protein